MMLMKNHAVDLILLGLLLSACVGAELPNTEWHFDFGSGPAAPGYTVCRHGTIYTDSLGFGFLGKAMPAGVDRDGDDPAARDFVTSDTPFYFSVKAPEGNYKVTVTLGDAQQASETTIKAELRRLMLEKVATEPGQTVQRSFIVNVRTPQIPGGGRVRLKGREKTQEAWAWDDQLTLEFNGARPCVCALDMVKVDDVPTVYILGDSTVCDQSHAPWNSWGQMLTRFFQPTVAVANHAESGESVRSSLGARRFDKVYSLLKPGDYVLAQFGHNDMKSKAEHASATYKQDLKAFVAKVRALGATPVLITSMERKRGMEAPTLEDYPDKMREVAAEDKVALIDLNKESVVLYKALGADLDKAFQDGTHHTNYGSYLFAECVAQGIKDSGLDLARHLAADFQGFDPAHPKPFASFSIPASPVVTDIKPLGD